MKYFWLYWQGAWNHDIFLALFAVCLKPWYISGFICSVPEIMILFWLYLQCAWIHDILLALLAGCLKSWYISGFICSVPEIMIYLSLHLRCAWNHDIFLALLAGCLKSWYISGFICSDSVIMIYFWLYLRCVWNHYTSEFICCYTYIDDIFWFIRGMYLTMMYPAIVAVHLHAWYASIYLRSAYSPDISCRIRNNE